MEEEQEEYKEKDINGVVLTSEDIKNIQNNMYEIVSKYDISCLYKSHLDFEDIISPSSSSASVFNSIVMHST